MKKSYTKITVNDIIKCALLLNMCRTIICNADPKFGGDIYLKMCSVFKLAKFCWPYTMGSYSYPFYTLPLPLPLPAPVPLSVAPFPLIVNPTQSIPQFTIPTVFTTNRPGGAPPNVGPPGPGGGMLPGPGPTPPAPQLPRPQCPPSPPICPPAALEMPLIDPRQGTISYLMVSFPLFYSFCLFDKIIILFNERFASIQWMSMH